MFKQLTFSRPRRCFIPTDERPSIRAISDPGRPRLVVIAIALLVLFFTMPRSFFEPAFWAEDGTLYSNAYNFGWSSLLLPLSGTLNIYGSIISNLANDLPVILVPWIQVYAAYAATLLIVYMAASPRFDMPHKTIASLAIVCVPARFEVFGFLTNAQWTSPIGLFILLFSRRSKSWLVFAAEGIFVLVAGLNGPVGVFILPLYLWQSCTVEKSQRTRLIILTGILSAVSLVQIYFLLHNLGVFELVEPGPPSPALRITMPLRWFDAVPLAQTLIGHYSEGAPFVIVGWIMLAAFAWRQPYRNQKFAMVYLATAILYSGMYKYRNNLLTVWEDSGRYIFAGSIFVFWFLCIAAATSRRFSHTIITVAAIMLAYGALRGTWSDRPRGPVPWSAVAPLVGKGPITVPIAPQGWVVNLLH